MLTSNLQELSVRGRLFSIRNDKHTPMENVVSIPVVIDIKLLSARKQLCIQNWHRNYAILKYDFVIICFIIVCDGTMICTDFMLPLLQRSMFTPNMLWSFNILQTRISMYFVYKFLDEILEIINADIQEIDLR